MMNRGPRSWTLILGLTAALALGACGEPAGSGDGTGEGTGAGTGTPAEPGAEPGTDPGPEGGTEIGPDGGPEADAETGAQADGGEEPEPDPGGEPTGPVDCPGDEMSAEGPHHSKDEARDLVNATDLEDLTVCAGQDDWYRVFSKDGFELQVEIKHKGEDPILKLDWFREEQPDLSVYVLGGGYVKEIDTTKVNTGLWQAPGVYYARVHTEEAEVSYDFRLLFKPWKLQSCTNFEEGGPCNGAMESKTCTHVPEKGEWYECHCNPDFAGTTDDPESALTFPLGPDPFGPDLSCADDEDWYKAFFAAEETVYWRLEAEGIDLIEDGNPATNWGNLPYLGNLEVYGPVPEEGEVEAPGPQVMLLPFGQNLYEDKMEITEEGVYYFRIWNVNLADIAYSLSMDTEPLPPPEE